MPINKNELTMERVRKALSGFSVCLLLLLFCGSSALAADIKLPTLIIVGSKDPYVSPALCEEAYKTLPDRNSRLEIIEGGGHAMLMERPYYRKFRAKVRAFLSRGAR